MHLRRKKPTEALTEKVDSAAANGEASGELGAEDASLLGAVDWLNLRRALHKLPSGYRHFAESPIPWINREPNPRMASLWQALN